MAQREIMPEHHIFRIIFQGSFIVFYRTIKLILANTRQSSYLISAHNKRIALNSQITIHFSTLKIIQINFGQCTKEIRLI